MKRTRAAILALALFAASAEAGRRPYIWAYSPEIVPDGSVEMEQWLWMRIFAPDTAPTAAPNPGLYTHYWIWWGPVIGVTDHLELALPFQILAPQGGVAWLDSFEADARYRIFSRLDRSPFQSLVRLAYHQAIGTPLPKVNGFEFSRIEANVVGSYSFESGLNLNLDLGTRVTLPALSDSTLPMGWTATYDLGASYGLGDELRVAAELFGELPLNVSSPAQSTASHHFVGPSLQWTRGRFWLTAGCLIGMRWWAPSTPAVMPRVIWAVSL